MPDATETVETETVETPETTATTTEETPPEEPATTAATPEPDPEPEPQQPAARREAIKDPRESELEQLTTLLASADADPFSEEYRRANLRRQDLTAELAAERPAKLARQQQEQAANYWRQWGRGEDVAQVQYGKQVNAGKAQQLWQDAAKSVSANPRYKRAEYLNNPQRLEAIVYEKWLDNLAAAATAKPGTPGAAPGSRGAPSTRATGRGGAETPAPNTGGMTAREKLAAGMYDGGLKQFDQNAGGE